MGGRRGRGPSVDGRHRGRIELADDREAGKARRLPRDMALRIEGVRHARDRVDDRDGRRAGRPILLAAHAAVFVTVDPSRGVLHDAIAVREHLGVVVDDLG